MSLDGDSGPAGSGASDRHSNSSVGERGHGADDVVGDAGDPGRKLVAPAKRGSRALVVRIARVLDSDVAWGAIVLGVIVTAATFAT